MLDSPPNLDEYRSVEELQRLAGDVQAELASMERESDGRPYRDAQRWTFSKPHRLRERSTACRASP